MDFGRVENPIRSIGISAVIDYSRESTATKLQPDSICQQPNIGTIDLSQRNAQRQKQEGDRQPVPGALVDASVLLADPDVIMRLQDKEFPVISTTLRQEFQLIKLRGRGVNEQILSNADKIHKFLDREEPRIVSTLPNGMTPRNNDRFLRFDLGSAELYQIARMFPQCSMSWQERIFPIARDYKLRLLTRDESQHLAARQAGVNSKVCMGKVKPPKEGSWTTRIRPLGAGDREPETTPEPNAGSGYNAHAVSRETLSAEVLDWWEGEQDKISQELEEMHLVDVQGKLGDLIESSSSKSLLSGEKFVQEKVKPEVEKFIESTYRDLFKQMEEAFLASVAEIEAMNATIDIEGWSYGNMAGSDGRIAHGDFPLAPLPKKKGAALAGVGMLIDILTVKQKWKDHLDPIVKLALLGDNARPEVVSLRGVLLSELRKAAQSRMEAIRQ